MKKRIREFFFIKFKATSRQQYFYRLIKIGQSAFPLCRRNENKKLLKSFKIKHHKLKFNYVEIFQQTKERHRALFDISFMQRTKAHPNLVIPFHTCSKTAKDWYRRTPQSNVNINYLFVPFYLSESPRVSMLWLFALFAFDSPICGISYIDLFDYEKLKSYLQLRVISLQTRISFIL